MTVPPTPHQPLGFDLPEAREPEEPRNYFGWVMLFLIFTLMIGMELVQYLGRDDKNPDGKYMQTYSQLKMAVEMKEAAKAVGAGSSAATGFADSLDTVASELEKDSTKNETAARLYGLTLSEQGKPVPATVLKKLRESKEPRDKTFADIYAAKTLTVEQAQGFEEKLKGGGFVSKLSIVQAYEKAGDKSRREKLVPPSKAYGKYAVLAAFGLAGCGGVMLLILYAVLKASRKLPTLGLPLERISIADADRLALKAAQIFAAFLAVPLALGFLFMLGGKSLDKHLVSFMTYLGLILATVLILKGPVLGKRFSLASVGISKENLGKNILWGATTAVANMPLVLGAALLGQWIFSGLPKPEHPITVEVSSGTSFWATAVLFFAASVGAPIIEEIMFRGTLLPALARVLGSPVIAILLQGLLFAAIHPTGIPAWLPLATVGATSGFLSRQTGSLVPSIVMHAVHNFGTMLFAKTLLGWF